LALRYVQELVVVSRPRQIAQAGASMSSISRSESGRGPDLPGASPSAEIAARAVGVQNEVPLKRGDDEETAAWRARNRRVTVSITGSEELNFNTTLCLAPTP
jgi:hypothetical protein